LGRYPWLAIVNNYIEAGAKHWSPETTSTKRRGLIRIGRNLELLKSLELISTTNPEKLTDKDIEAYDRWNAERELTDQKGKKIKIVSRVKDIEMINGLTLFCGNPVVEAMRKMPGHQGLPKRPALGPKVSYSEKTVLSVLETALNAAREAVRPKQWGAIATLGWLVIENGFGPRPREARMLQLGDLDIRQFKIRVNHPKGEGQWADGDWVTLIPTFAPYMIEFLKLRANFLTQTGIDPNDLQIPLIPKIVKGRTEIYSSKQVALTHRKLAKATGIKLRPKDGRTSFGQNFIDHGFTVDEVSKRMRHATVATTQRFYIELRPDDDFERLRARYEASKGSQIGKAPKVNSSGLTEKEALNYYR